MEKSSSFFDWELKFKKNNKNLDRKVFSKKDKFKENSLGIPQKHFKQFLNEWRKRNFLQSS